MKPKKPTVRRHTTITLTEEALALLPPGKSMSARINLAIIAASRAADPYPVFRADGVKVWKMLAGPGGKLARDYLLATAPTEGIAAALAAHLEATGFVSPGYAVPLLR